ncbi:hypothetical protein AUEXF2481DRAFT_91639 [Aureobasidium subglaciale EXF-2481]|uniref:Uncharacterized protein n=1 Tax=Aureobasidium subglaciale (strain EXF-2481) TaxID=1043005 RepID=A0A074Y7U8_AURSE|nr:uncharacterized protein AUEXF2481DRAFT_91639 [Aureobasidium subglaciale EXF-2481]KEQ92039.1 hypothetical protein AUEXF2481DRAFT_91639 [Aureobasidium subglaciale EXF-2481]
MSPSTRSTTEMSTPPTKKDQLASKIAHLKLRLAPLVPLPAGSPHPDFPRTLLDYHLLTEEQLDGIASYYHQSTPGIWTYQYPACMNWDKEMLAKRRASVAQHLRRASQVESNQWWESLLAAEEAENAVVVKRRPSVQFTEGLTDAERISIKRRKFGKFIGLMNCETPVEEIEGRLRASMKKAIRLAQEELRRAEEWELRRSKMA